MARMAKVVVQFTCSECGTTTGRWLGKCPGCGAFGTLVEELTGQRRPGGTRRRRVARDAAAPRRRPGRGGCADRDRASPSSTACSAAGSSRPRSCSSAASRGSASRRCSSRALGAIARDGRRGAPRHRGGVGRAGEAARRAPRRRRRRRDPRRDRARRRLRDARAVRPDVCVIDSVQTLLLRPSSARRPGSVAQVREAASRLLRVAKESGRRDRARRPRDEGRRGRRAHACSSTSSTACCSSRATATTRIASCARSRTASARRTSSGSSR